MRLRVIDYVASEAGGIRVSGEMLKALISIRPEVICEVVSWGFGLALYKRYLSGLGDRIRILEMKPLRSWRNGHDRVLNVPGSRRLIKAIGAQRIEYEVSGRAFLGSDAAWLPWGSRHLIPEESSHIVVATLHDIIPLEFEKTSTPRWRAAERKTLQRLISSKAHIVTVSGATSDAIARRFGTGLERLRVIPLADTHTVEGETPLPADWEWSRGRFIISPANIAPHKNHEGLLLGVSAWRGGIPLVLVGNGSDLRIDSARGAELRAMAFELGFEQGRTLIPLGFVSDDLYWTMLSRSWAVVIPSLAEGAGLPLMEALVRGVPVICSSVEAMREQADRLGAKVLWFDPHDPGELVLRLRELESNYDSYKRAAVAQVPELRRRSWSQVAGEYWQLFEMLAADVKRQ